MDIDRREFMRRMAALGFSVAAAGALFSSLACGSKETPVTTPAPPTSTPGAAPPPVTPIPAPDGTYLAVARGKSPAALVQAAVKALGGIERYVKQGNEVIIKPNICVAHRTYEYAATTNPEVIAELVKLSIGAGAKRVRVMDTPFSGTADQAYVRSGIGEAVKAAGGQMEIMTPAKYREVALPNGKDITKWKIYDAVLDADVLINVPIAKHHQLARLTLGMKNLMGVIQNRGEFHLNLGQRVADLSSLLKPAFTMIDCVRILMNGGPSGGDLNSVKLTNTIIASRDIVAADAYAVTLFGLQADDIPSIRAAAQMGLGKTDLKSIKIEEIAI
jgi:uncharacterized protein (DUF362 family)